MPVLLGSTRFGGCRRHGQGRPLPQGGVGCAPFPPVVSTALRLRLASALAAPGRLPGAWRGFRGRRSAVQRRARAAGWWRIPTARSHLPRAGRHCIYRRRRRREGAAAGDGGQGRAGPTGGSWPSPGAALRGRKRARPGSGERGAASAPRAGGPGRFRARGCAREEPASK